MLGLLVACLSPSAETISLTVDGESRSAIVYAPTVKSNGKPAVYFVFHGFGASAKEAEVQFHIQKLDPSAYVIYGQGEPASFGRIGGQRHGGLQGRNTWQITPGQYRDRDIHFVQALMKWADNAGADASKRYCMGHSNGSFFSWVVLKELGAQFARFVGLEGPAAFNIAGVPARPAFLTAGSRDQLVNSEAVQTCTESLAKNNGCSAGSGSPVKTYAGANPVYLYTYEGGHVPPANVYEMAVKFCQTGRV